jgi:hypothetical protein
MVVPADAVAPPGLVFPPEMVAPADAVAPPGLVFPPMLVEPPELVVPAPPPAPPLMIEPPELCVPLLLLLEQAETTTIAERKKTVDRVLLLFMRDSL